MNSTNSIHAFQAERPSTEVTAKATRRRFTGEYKRKILQEADACTAPGELGALLRREGLYSSVLAKWRRARDRGELAGLSPKKRGPKPGEVNPLAKKLAQSERENARLKAQLHKSQLMLDLQKKVSEILGITLPPAPPDEDEPNGSRS